MIGYYFEKGIQQQSFMAKTYRQRIHRFLTHFFFFSICHALKTWFELSRIKLYRNDLKGKKITSS